MPSFTERYHELTKYNPNTIDRLGQVSWEEQPYPFKEDVAKRAVALKPLLEKLPELPEMNRDRMAPGGRLTDAGLAALLHFTGGITARFETQGGYHYLRANPSAGGLYPVEIYAAVFRVDGIPSALYHYHSLRAVLDRLPEDLDGAHWKRVFLGGFEPEDCQLLVLFTGIYRRSVWRYKERAYRRILLDTGHAAANLLEVCQCWGLSAFPLGGFYDEILEESMHLKCKAEFPLLGVYLPLPGTQTGLRPIQWPSAPPAVAVRHVDGDDPVQVQQNACERIREGGEQRDAEPAIASGIPSGLAESQIAIDAPFAPIGVLGAIARRRSCRDFAGEPMEAQTVRDLLRCAYRGMQPIRWNMVPGYLDHHLVALRVRGMQPGIYALNPLTLETDLRIAGDFQSEFFQICLSQELAAACSFLLVHTVNLAKLTAAYGDRGYRYACMDAGQIGERINLAAVARDLGSSGIGGYFDDLANEVLQLSLTEAILYITVAGVPA